MGVEFATEQAVFVEMEDVNFSDSELVHHVRGALRLVYEGDTDSYNQLIGVLHHRERLTPDEVALLVTSLKALTGAVSCISDQHSSLVSSIFGMSLWDYGPDVMDALAELVVSLAASSGKYRDGCLKMLVSNFMPHPTFRESLKHPRGIARKEQVLCRVHSALQEIEHLVPLSSDSLGGIIIDRIRFAKKISERDLTLYVESMLRLESGDLGKAIGCTMLMGLVDKLIDLDVQIGWDDILQDDSTKGIFEMELEDVEGITLDAEQDGDELLIDSFAEKNFSIGDKLDSLMVLTFEHLESCNTGGRMIQVFETLLGSFNKTVLTTHKSKFAQFVMFYSCSLDPENCGVRFARVLSDTFMGRESPPLHRMSAVAYLASYLSRAKFLSASLVCFILERLVNWCWEYCQTQDGDINPEVHKVFYSGCQAMMYVLCFRMRSMMGIPQLKSQLLIMPIEAILKHPLDPLKVCLPSIVEEFLRQAKAAHLFTVSETFIFNDLLESELSRAFGGLERLDMFFPFDPYLLKKSDRFIRPNFIYWSMVTTTYDNEDDSTDDDDAPSPRVGNGENIADYDGMASSFEDNDVDLDEFDYSLNKMSITPRNSSLKYSFGGEFGGPMQMPSRIRPSTSPESL